MLLIDAHVHIYDCFDLATFFDAAYTNFQLAADQSDNGRNFIGLLLLTETSKDNWFQQLTEYAEGKDLPEGKHTGQWRFRCTEEGESLVAESGNTKKLLLIAGRQMVTGEGLEVLSCGTVRKFIDGAPIKNLIEDVKTAGGIPIIPWGFGKWMGQRGTIINRFIKAAKAFEFYLGDNGNRPSFMSLPSQFVQAQERKIYNLPGSDPLPFVSEVNRAGCFGSILPDELAVEKPAEHLKRILKKPDHSFKHYGKLEQPYRCIRNQVASQLRKRFKR